MSSLESFVSQLPTRASTPFAFLVADLDIGRMLALRPLENPLNPSSLSVEATLTKCPILTPLPT